MLRKSKPSAHQRCLARQTKRIKRKTAIYVSMHKFILLRQIICDNMEWFLSKIYIRDPKGQDILWDDLYEIHLNQVLINSNKQ